MAAVMPVRKGNLQVQMEGRVSGTLPIIDMLGRVHRLPR